MRIEAFLIKIGELLFCKLKSARAGCCEVTNYYFWTNDVAMRHLENCLCPVFCPKKFVYRVIFLTHLYLR